MDWRQYSYRFAGASPAFRTVLVLVGVLLLSFGLLILIVPWLLRFLIGGTFVAIGLAMLGAAARRPAAPPQRRQADGESDVIDEWR